MNVNRFALILGIVYIAFGILGLISGFLVAPTGEAPDLSVTTLYGYIVGLFVVNILLTVIHLAIGVWGVVVSGNTLQSLMFARSVAIIFAILTIFGLVPGLNTVFGLMPLYGNNIWLHALTAIIAAYFGFFRYSAGSANLDSSNLTRRRPISDKL